MSLAESNNKANRVTLSLFDSFLFFSFEVSLFACSFVSVNDELSFEKRRNEKGKRE
jgi:hypothetical protein